VSIDPGQNHQNVTFSNKESKINLLLLKNRY
jgi:hypothetical protein